MRAAVGGDCPSTEPSCLPRLSFSAPDSDCSSSSAVCFSTPSTARFRPGELAAVSPAKSSDSSIIAKQFQFQYQSRNTKDPLKHSDFKNIPNFIRYLYPPKRDTTNLLNEYLHHNTRICYSLSFFHNLLFMLVNFVIFLFLYV